ncbi:MAG: peptide deformylase [Succinivibrio sp.]|nr:peptide deformylase [Succinivibrio sp.]
MALRNVLVFPDPRLRNKNTDVTVFDEELKTLVADMFETMYKHDGIGLAAPQIGVNKNLVVIDIPDENGTQGQHQLALINPVIVQKEGELIESEEGCLSVPGYQDKVMRYPHCSVHAVDVDGKEQNLDNLEGLLAICVQHELDHLSGKLFVDYLSRLKRERLAKKYSKLTKRGD